MKKQNKNCFFICFFKLRYADFIGINVLNNSPIKN
jgi:hypothetical protein